MEGTNHNLTKNWEVSIMELQNDVGSKFKVTRKLPELSVSETKMFRSKTEAVKQFEEWLQ